MNQFNQISLIASFIAGMVALFAPCCFSYLLPAYFGNIFKEKKRVILMTLIYSLGIFVVMLPIVLGAKVLAGLIFQLHDQTYIIGSLFMILVAILAFLGIKLPMPQITRHSPGKLGSRLRKPNRPTFTTILMTACGRIWPRLQERRLMSAIRPMP